jgi:uronate dehydrogenase
MKILVTGSAGVVGRPVCQELLRQGHDVKGLDRRPSPDLIDAVVADIADAAAVRAAVAGMDAVVHLAAQPVDAPFAELVGPNVVGLYNVFDACREAGIKRLVLASSVMIVIRNLERGRPATVEESWPGDHYALTKRWAEEMGAMYARRFGMSILAVRIGWVVRNPDEARHMLKLGIFDIYFSRADAGRFFAAAVAAKGIDFAVVYATSRGGEKVFDMEPARRLLGYEPRETWPEGLPFPLPTD